VFSWGNGDKDVREDKGVDYAEPKNPFESSKEFKDEETREALVFVQAAAGYSHNTAITDKGRIYTWGDCG
jgi:alpha-tubulin suppressor-like RCC1 family protein